MDSVIQTEFNHEVFGRMTARCAAIDSGGHFTHEVYQFTREKRKKRYIAVKGSSRKDSPLIGKPRKMDINFRGKTIKSGAELNILNVHMIKDVLLPRWKHGERVHFHIDLTDDYFEQLTSEKKVVQMKSGQPEYVYVRDPKKRNEGLDCSVYAWGALAFLKRGYDPAKFYDFMEKKHLKNNEPVTEESEKPTYPQEKTEIENPVKKPQRKKRRLLVPKESWR